MDLVKISSPDFDVDLQIAYAAADNFTGKPVYGRAACLLRQEASQALSKAIDIAAVQGLRFKVFDAFRPTEAQYILWDHTPDPNFLAPPDRGSPHSRGVAVDLTLVDGQGNDLDMGTAFDAFTPLSHHGNGDISPKAQANRHLLLGIMTASGWNFYGNEWWHYQLFDTPRFALISDTELPHPMM